jgi:hypothetical protein
MPSQPSSPGIFSEMMTITKDEESSRQFLLQKGILLTTVQCACTSTMTLKPCSATKSPDLWIFRCSATGCSKTKSCRFGSYLSNSKIPFSSLLQLLYCFSSKNLTNVDTAAYTGLSRKAVTEWKASLLEAVTIWILNNPQPIGGLGEIVEIDEAMMGRRKYNRGTLREGAWVLGGVCRRTGHCFLIQCPNNRRDARTLLPLIQRHVLPGTTIHTDQWAGYNQLSSLGYTHHTVNHTLNFVDPTTGVHTNMQEGLWHHVKRQLDSKQSLEHVFIEFVFRRRFNASTGECQIRNAFNGFLTVLRS